MLVCSRAKYSRSPLGPNASSLQWQKAVKKFQVIITTVHALRLPADPAQRQYTSSALPTLRYLAQIAPPGIAGE